MACKSIWTRLSRDLRLLVTAFAFGSVCIPVNADPYPPFPAQPDGVSYPTLAWPEAAPDPDVAPTLSALIEEAMVRESGELMGTTRAIVVIHKGALIAEAYRDGFRADTKQVSWSMAKSITQGLVGRAVANGEIADIDSAMPSPWPAEDPRAAITWRQWLEMTDGLAYRELGEETFLENDVVQMMYGRGRFDSAAYVRDLPLLEPPGVRWNYSTAGLHMVGRALGDVWVHASPSDLAETFNQELFAPLGMDAVVEFDAAGTYLGGSLVWASARDFAKFGLLYLRGGQWDGEALLPDGWADWARRGAQTDDGNVYGAGFWLAESPSRATAPEQMPDLGPYDAFSAQGFQGQMIWIVPSRDLVIVRLGVMGDSRANWKALNNWCQDVANLFPVVAPQN